MLSFQDFFSSCCGLWHTERIYHYPRDMQKVERSVTEFRVLSLEESAKTAILSPYLNGGRLSITANALNQSDPGCPGFSIAFDTRSEAGEEVSMKLHALFIPDCYVAGSTLDQLNVPIAAEVAPNEEVIRGLYLRDEGYSEMGAIVGQFTYQPTRQTLEMTTYYRRSVAVDQMRLVSPNLRMRSILTYHRPEAGSPTDITLIGFGIEYRQAL